MKITLLTSTYPDKGISIYSDHLIRALSSARADLEVISFDHMYPEFLYPNGSKDENKRDYSTNLPCRRIINWYDPLSWFRAGLLAKGDVVHVEWWTHMLFPVYFIFLLINKTFRKKKVIITMHNVVSHENRVISKVLNKIITLFGDRFIVHNNKNKIEMHDLYSVGLDRITVIPIGIYNNANYQKQNKDKARKKIGLSQNDIYLFFGGHIRDYKGLDVLLRAFSLVIKEVTGLKLIIAGTLWGKWDKYQTLIDKYKLKDSIIKKLEYISDEYLSELLSASDLVVLPYKRFSSSSGFVKTVMYFEKPIISTNVGDMGEVIGDNKLLARPNDPTDLADKITKALTDSSILTTLEKNIKNSKAKFSWEQIALEHMTLYHRWQ